MVDGKTYDYIIIGGALCRRRSSPVLFQADYQSLTFLRWHGGLRGCFAIVRGSRRLGSSARKGLCQEQPSVA